MYKLMLDGQVLIVAKCIVNEMILSIISASIFSINSSKVYCKFWN